MPARGEGRKCAGWSNGVGGVIDRILEGRTAADHALGLCRRGGSSALMGDLPGGGPQIELVSQLPRLLQTRLQLWLPRFEKEGRRYHPNRPRYPRLFHEGLSCANQYLNVCNSCLSSSDRAMRRVISIPWFVSTSNSLQVRMGPR